VLFFTPSFFNFNVKFYCFSNYMYCVFQHQYIFESIITYKESKTTIRWRCTKCQTPSSLEPSCNAQPPKKKTTAKQNDFCFHYIMHTRKIDRVLFCPHVQNDGVLFVRVFISTGYYLSE